MSRLRRALAEQPAPLPVAPKVTAVSPRREFEFIEIVGRPQAEDGHARAFSATPHARSEKQLKREVWSLGERGAASLFEHWHLAPETVNAFAHDLRELHDGSVCALHDILHSDGEEMDENSEAFVDSEVHCEGRGRNLWISFPAPGCSRLIVARNFIIALSAWEMLPADERMITGVVSTAGAVSETGAKLLEQLLKHMDDQCAQEQTAAAVWLYDASDQDETETERRTAFLSAIAGRAGVGYWQYRPSGDIQNWNDLLAASKHSLDLQNEHAESASVHSEPSPTEPEVQAPTATEDSHSANATVALIPSQPEPQVLLEFRSVKGRVYYLREIDLIAAAETGAKHVPLCDAMGNLIPAEQAASRIERFILDEHVLPTMARARWVFAIQADVCEPALGPQIEPVITPATHESMVAELPSDLGENGAVDDRLLCLKFASEMGEGEVYFVRRTDLEAALQSGIQMVPLCDETGVYLPEDADFTVFDSSYFPQCEVEEVRAKSVSAGLTQANAGQRPPRRRKR